MGFVYAANLVEDSEAAIVLYQPTGAPGRRRTGRRGGPRGRNMLPGGWDGRHQDMTWSGPGTTRLHPPGCGFAVLRRWSDADGRYTDWYVNLERPWRRTPLGFDTCDDVLDVVVADDLSGWHLKDDDELAWSVEVGKISREEAVGIRRAADVVVALVEGRAWPFDEDAWAAFAPDPTWPMPCLPDNWDVSEP